MPPPVTRVASTLVTDNSLHPFFVASIGATLEEDAVYLPEAEDEDDTFYVLASPTEISATGVRFDDKISHLQRELMYGERFLSLGVLWVPTCFCRVRQRPPP
jgi:hypothetical protein